MKEKEKETRQPDSLKREMERRFPGIEDLEQVYRSLEALDRTVERTERALGRSHTSYASTTTT